MSKPGGDEEVEEAAAAAAAAGSSSEASLIWVSSELVSSFELALANRLSLSIDSKRIKSIFQFGGFHLDTVVLSDQPGNKNLAMECNGGQDIDDTEAYIHLQYRKKLLDSFSSFACMAQVERQGGCSCVPIASVFLADHPLVGPTVCGND